MPLSHLLDCNVRRYLDDGEHFHIQDLFMLTEMTIAAVVSEIYLAGVLPLFGLPRDTPFPIAPLSPRLAIFLAGPMLYLLMYAVVCGSIFYLYTYRYPAEGQRLSIQKKQMTQLEIRRAVVFSIKSILSVSAVSAYPYYVIQGWTNIYWGLPLPIDILSCLCAYVLIDINSYVVHRALHRPWWYRHVHKAHHLWKSPNAFVVSALHPAEFLALTVPTLAILVALPMSVCSALFLLAWIFVCNAIDHSGLELHTSPWLSWLFWQAPVNFHDNHHKFFHANYGAMVDWWDRLGGTYYHPQEHGPLSLGEAEFRSVRALRKDWGKQCSSRPAKVEIDQ
mmetsp:Transcript_56708/g.132546  ORF Transcript_56708/g.132546 Transcript_56708/m.132546 type:complete len:335 (-) Transcript_56708:140-1144(-)